MLMTLILVTICILPTAALAEPRFPFPQHQTYAPETLFPNHRSTAELDDDVRAAYWRWRGKYLTQAGAEADEHPRYRVKTADDASANTVSEGQGYGMLITVLMAGEDPNAQTAFDGLWEFFNDHRSASDPRLMDWKVAANEVPDPSGNNSAFDGDCDIALALLLAEQQWGNDGRLNYHNAALSVLAGLLGSTIGPVSRLPLLGDWVNPAGAVHNERTPRSSDFMPNHFRAFAQVTGDPAWETVLTATQQVVSSLQASASPTTGLLPDFIVPISTVDPTPKPAPAFFLEGPHDSDYYYNAGRVPWRLAVDALLSNNAVSRQQALKISLWAKAAAGGNPQNIKPGYLLDGTPIPPANYFTTFFAAPLGVAAMLDPAGQQWLNNIYDAVVTREEGYFEDSVALLSLLVMTRNYWDPMRVATLFEDGFESGSTNIWNSVSPGSVRAPGSV